MLYIHYCEKCKKVHMLNGHKNDCPGCGDSLRELPVSFLQYTSYSSAERADFLKRQLS